MRFLAVSLLLALAVAPGQTASTRVHDVEGRVWTPLAPAQGQVHVVFFVMSDCPNSNGYAPEIGRIAAEYRTRGVQAFLVYVDGTMSADAARRHRASYYPHEAPPAIVEHALALAEAAGATIAPEAAVYTPAGRAYRGRIDDLHIDIGRRRRAPTERTLRNAIDAVLAGRPVPRAETQAVGCYIEKGR